MTYYALVKFQARNDLDLQELSNHIFQDLDLSGGIVEDVAVIRGNSPNAPKIQDAIEDIFPGDIAFKE